VRTCKTARRRSGHEHQAADVGVTIDMTRLASGPSDGHTFRMVTPAAARASVSSVGAASSVTTTSSAVAGVTKARPVRVNLLASATAMIRCAEAIAARLTAASARS
jgi:hypothetical protein